MIRQKINVDGKEGEFEVFSPGDKYKGKTYGQYLANSWNKVISRDPDASDDDVIFLRTSPNPQEAPLRKKVTIFPDQAIFVPIISAVINTDDSPDYNNELKRREAANKTISAGDNPPRPEQVTIDGMPIVDDLTEFRIESPEFLLNVQDQSPLRKRLEVIYQIGDLSTVVVGYCVLIKSLPSRSRPYTIHTKAKGEGDYQAEAFYEVQVIDRK